MPSKTFALTLNLMRKRLMTILNLTSLLASIKASSSTNGRPLNPEKRKWKISAKYRLKMRNVESVKKMLVVLPENVKSANKNKLSVEKREKNLIKRSSVLSSKKRSSVPKNVSKRN